MSDRALTLPLRALTTIPNTPTSVTNSRMVSIIVVPTNKIPRNQSFMLINGLLGVVLVITEFSLCVFYSEDRLLIGGQHIQYLALRVPVPIYRWENDTI